VTDPNPWARKGEPPPPPHRGSRLLIWIALALAVTAGLIWLARQFPGAISSEDQPWLVYMVIWLALLSAGFVFSRQLKLRESLRNIAIWIAIAAVLVIGYSYRDALSALGTRVQSEFLPGDAVVSGDHTLVLTQDDTGEFHIYGEANGVRIRFVVDTGASDIVLSPADAKRLGIDTGHLVFNRSYETANGIGYGAATTLPQLSIGPIQLWNVPVSINRTEMESSLLGMAFLKQMKSFEIRGRKLTIHW
jgi:aspartyl protease family protein